jgi:hypothetical protein
MPGLGGKEDFVVCEFCAGLGHPQNILQRVHKLKLELTCPINHPA